MAKDSVKQEGAEVVVKNPAATASTPAAAVTPADAQPDRGGSFTRNKDGSLTQTEGHGFAHDNKE